MKDTALSRLKDTFKNFENTFSIKKSFEQTKRDEKTKHTCYSGSFTQNAVLNDFIRVYKILPIEDKFKSFAIAFNKIEGEIDKTEITISVYLSEDKKYYNTFYFSTFKDLFKELIKNYKDVTYDLIIRHFSLIEQSYTETELVNKFFEDKEVNLTMEKVNENDTLYKNLDKSLRTDKKGIDKKVREYKEKLEKELNIPYRENLLNTYSENKEGYKNELTKLMEPFLTKLFKNKEISFPYKKFSQLIKDSLKS